MPAQHFNYDDAREAAIQELVRMLAEWVVEDYLREQQSKEEAEAPGEN